MKPDLTPYENKRICVAVSGGRDSAALLHYLHARAPQLNLTLTALNCDHGIRGESSARDSAFVKELCDGLGVPLLFFKRTDAENGSEDSARQWRRRCYAAALKPEGLWGENDEYPAAIPEGGWFGADAVATAHHLDDNAETVLFNLARGSGLSGLTGITDCSDVPLIRPFIGVSRAEIEAYIGGNGIKFVDDETNFTDGYTRNKLRLNVLPALENAVHGAARSIYRFSRLAAEDEDYFDRLIARQSLINTTPNGVVISFCDEKAVFKRVAIKAIKTYGDIRDYTLEHAERLYNLQFSENGKKFEFLGFTAYKEEGGIAICKTKANEAESIPLADFIARNCGIFGGQLLEIVPQCQIESVLNARRDKLKVLKYDAATMPANAVVRFMREGDKFQKFGGGTKKLGDYFTDKKIPLRMRKSIPLIAAGSDIYAVCGVEISDKIRLCGDSADIYYIISADFSG